MYVSTENKFLRYFCLYWDQNYPILILLSVKLNYTAYIMFSNPYNDVTTLPSFVIS